MEKNLFPLKRKSRLELRESQINQIQILASQAIIKIQKKENLLENL